MGKIRFMRKNPNNLKLCGVNFYVEIKIDFCLYPVSFLWPVFKFFILLEHISYRE